MSAQVSPKDRETVRINLEVTPSVRDQIKELRVKSEATSLAEVFRRALAIYELVIDFQKQGGKIVLESRDGERETLRIL
ncbi:MAG: hypothetical protein ABIS50_25525 [Luteolibacter sp.]|uniref:hypothetical protein n=1 Tax=Luteolibacter sp. TaxID=1962973 RepID=UPI003264E8B6